MKSYSVTRQCYGVAVRRLAVTTIKIAVAAAFAVAMAGPSQAQDDSASGSSWDWLNSVRLDSVLVLPPVYRPDAGSVPADACAEDCPGSSDQGIGEPPSAVGGTADDPANASAGTADNPAAENAAADGSTSDGSGAQEQQAAVGGDPQTADDLGSSLGSIEDYEAQQEAAAEFVNYGIVQAPSVIIAVPVRPYYVAGISPVFARRARVAPLPSIVPHGVPVTVGGFSRGFVGGFRAGSFSGFHGGFGHR
jgi:hypothetical protein